MKPEGTVFDREWRRRASVRRVSIGDVMPMLRRHYLRKRPAVVPCVLALFVEDSIVPLGCCVFALAPKQTSARYGGETWELARLWIDDAVPKNAETWLISQAVRYVARTFPFVRFLVSYADPSVGHAGTIYLAANWKPDGRTDDDRKSARVDYMVEGRVFSRRAHVPPGAAVERRPRISKRRFIYALPVGSGRDERGGVRVGVWGVDPRPSCAKVEAA